MKISLLTNGTMLTKECARSLIDARPSELWISMDRFEKECYEAIQLGSRFDLICRNIASFNETRRDTGVKLGITLVVTFTRKSERLQAFLTEILKKNLCWNAGMTKGILNFVKR